MVPKRPESLRAFLARCLRSGSDCGHRPIELAGSGQFLPCFQRSLGSQTDPGATGFLQPPSGDGESRTYTRPCRTPPNASEPSSPEPQCPPPSIRKLPSIAGQENRASAAVRRSLRRAEGGAKMAGGCGREAAGIVEDSAAKWRPCGQVRRAGLSDRRDSVVMLSR